MIWRYELLSVAAILYCFSSSAAQERGGLGELVGPIVTDRTIVVIRVNLAETYVQIGQAHIRRIVRTKRRKNTYGMALPFTTLAMRNSIAILKKRGAKEVLVFLNDGKGMVFAVPVVESKEKNEQLMAYFRDQVKAPSVAVVGKLMVASNHKLSSESKSATRKIKQLNAAFAAVKDYPIQFVFPLGTKVRQTTAKLRLPKPLHRAVGGDGAKLMQCCQWGAAGLSPVLGKNLTMIVQAKNAETARSLDAMADRAVAEYAKSQTPWMVFAAKVISKVKRIRAQDRIEIRLDMMKHIGPIIKKYVEED